MDIDTIEVTESAFEVLVAAMGDARRDNRELGGSILAHERDGSVLVAYALPTGPCADRGPGHLRTDAEFQNQAMAKVRKQCPALQYVGDWHVHPMWLPELSGTDRRTAREILLDDGTRRDHLVLLLVTAPPGGAAVVLGFVARRSQARSVAIGKVPVTRVPDDSRRVVSVLGRPLPPLRDLLRSERAATSSRAAGSPSMSFEDLPMLRLVEDDLADVQESLNADTSLWRDEETLAAVIRRGDREAMVLFPPEYPLGAPQVFSVPPDQGPSVPVPLRFGWSSLHCLADPVSEALAETTSQAEASSAADAPTPASSRTAAPRAPSPLIAPRLPGRRDMAAPHRSLATLPPSRTLRVLDALLSLFGLRRLARSVASKHGEVAS